MPTLCQLSFSHVSLIPLPQPSPRLTGSTKTPTSARARISPLLGPYFLFSPHYFHPPHTPINHIIIFCCITSVFLSLRAADISPPTLAMTSTQLPSPGSFPGISRDPDKATGRCFGGSVPRISTITTSSKIDFCLLLDSSRLGFLAFLRLAPRTSAGFRSKMGRFCFALAGRFMAPG